MKSRLVLLAALAALAGALLLAACGDSGSDGTEPAAATPPGAPIYIEAEVRPDGEVAKNIDALAKEVAGIDNLGELIATELESAAAADGAELDFEAEVLPWLGEKAAIFLQEYDGEDFQGAGGALQVSDEGEAEEFINRAIEESGESPEEGEYEGVDFKIDDEGTCIGFSDGLLLYAEDEEIFKQMVDALEGENLEESEAFDAATESVPTGSIGDVYVDIGALIQESGEGIDEETRLGLQLMGIDPEGATALISLVPGADTLALEINSNVTSGAAAGGDASGLLGSLPAGSVLALATPEYGAALEEIVDQIDKEGIPGEIPPNQFKRSLQGSGIDLDAILGSIGDVGLFVEGNSERALGGAVVIESRDPTQSRTTVQNLGTLLRASGVPGVTAYRQGGFAGFSVNSPELGPKPLIVAAGGSKTVIAFGPKAAAAALTEKAGTLAQDPAFKAAKAALGDTPISGFLAGPQALELFEALASPLEVAELDLARPYIEKLGWLAIGGSGEGESTTGTIVAGLAK